MVMLKLFKAFKLIRNERKGRDAMGSLLLFLSGS